MRSEPACAPGTPYPLRQILGVCTATLASGSASNSLHRSTSASFASKSSEFVFAGRFRVMRRAWPCAS